jgi:GTP 3',8-cyclase
MKKGTEERLEWLDKFKYNSFNSYKGLAYINEYCAIAGWVKGEAKLLPPVECSLDPVHLCNFRCGHCNAQRYLGRGKKSGVVKNGIMNREHMRNLADFFCDWGVKGICIGGGGEPLMNEGVWGLASYIANKGMQSSFATNGSLIDEPMADEMMHCRWVGVSVDSADKATFRRVHGKDEFDKVISNLRLLVKKKKSSGSRVDIAYKVLVRPDNIDSIMLACRLAKEIGVDDFHVRPVDLERKDFKSAINLNYNIPKILDIFHACHELEDDGFRVFTVMHKYDRNFRVVHTFKKCLSAPLMIQCCADGFVYTCADHRIEKRFRLGSHFPKPQNILKLWGSDKHRRLLNSIDVDGECGRCTLGEYARQIEEVVINDQMCLNFP